MAAVLGTDFFEKCYTPLGEVMDLVALVNCTVNFLLYSLMSRQFRITFRKTFHLREARKGSDASLARDKKGSPSQLPPKAEYSMVSSSVKWLWKGNTKKHNWYIQYRWYFPRPLQIKIFWHRLEMLALEKTSNFYVLELWKYVLFRCLFKACSERATEQPQQVSGLNIQFYKPLKCGVFSKNLPKLFLWCYCDKLWRRKNYLWSNISKGKSSFKE